MIAEGQSFISSAWWICLFPGLAIVLLAIGFSMLADGFAESFGLRRIAHAAAGHPRPVRPVRRPRTGCWARWTA